MWSNIVLRSGAIALLAAAALAPIRSAVSATNPSSTNEFLQMGPGLSGDVINERDGTAVALAGDWLFVGCASSSAPGLVRVYQRDSQDYWAYYTTIPSPADENGDQFGASLALDGNTLVVGAPHATNGGNAGAGRAFVFTHSVIYTSSPPYTKDVFLLTAELASPSSNIGDGFGFSVALNGDNAAVGIPYADRVVVAPRYTIYTDAGLAAVYQRNSGGTNAWGRTATINGDLDSYDNFGYAMALGVNGALLVGSPGARVTPAGGSTVHSGRAYFFTVQSGGSAVYNYYVGTATPAEGRRFGAALAIDSALAAIGAPVTVGSDLASVDILEPNGSGTYSYISQINSVYAGAHPAYPFGTSVAVSGTRILVGTPDQVDVGITLFDNVVGYGNTNWYDVDNFFASSVDVGLANASSGYSVAFDGVTVSTGAPTAVYDEYSDSGVAFVFTSDIIFRNGFEIPGY